MLQVLTFPFSTKFQKNNALYCDIIEDLSVILFTFIPCPQRTLQSDHAPTVQLAHGPRLQPTTEIGSDEFEHFPMHVIDLETSYYEKKQIPKSLTE